MAKIFNDRYEIIEKIGTGGMADVFKATDNVLERTVAIKVLHPQYASESSFIGRFRTEAKSAANLNHANIVNIYDWGQQEDQYYIVMEHIEGKNLKEILAEKGKLNWKDSALIGKKIASALSFAHKNDVVHRDIKPHNIIISGKDVKVTDFGIARAGASTMTQTGTILGTAHYISPEQAQGRPADARSDIYSLGIVLYESVTGKMPFDGDNPVSIAMKHVSEAIPDFEGEDIPENFQNVIKKALAKDPNERYQNAEELRQDIDKALAGQNVIAPLPSEEKTVVITPGGSKPTSADKKTKPKRKKLPYFIVALIAIFALLWGAYALFGSGKKVLVPDIKGMKTSQASRLLKKRNLTLKVVERRYSGELEKDLIIGQNPDNGEKVIGGTVIEVTVSKGIETVLVPDVTGQTRNEAEQTLSNAGLTLGKITYQESESETGIVLSQSPGSGEELARNEAVGLVLSKEMTKVTVPNVIGKSKSSTNSILSQLGFQISFSEEYSDSVDKGYVIDQSPTAGSSENKSSTVTVYISKGPKYTKVKVPDVSGLAKNTAISQLQAVGFRVSTSGSGGTVDRQSPVAGSKINEGSTVTIYLVP